MSLVNNAIMLLTELGIDYDRLADDATLSFLLGEPDERGHHPGTAAALIGLAALADELAYDLAQATGRGQEEVLQHLALRHAARTWPMQ